MAAGWKYALVFVGGGLGAALRYWAQGLVYSRTGTGFPYGTLVVNLTGCFVIGLLMVALRERFLAAPSLRLFLTIGVLGGYTTFSSFSYETMALLQDGEILYAFSNAGLSLLVGLAATWVGMVAGAAF
ncbi:MAG TPA: fluoride efflux transporter CrcB [Holophaga sp.]|nr:fluoride efflux transporter CrcB [Holophaga sp.]